MKIFEFVFEEPDAHRDMLRHLALPRRDGLVREGTQENETRVSNFINSIIGYDIPQNQLKVDDYYYCPMDIGYNLMQTKIDLYTVVNPAKYIKEEGSRLWFKYDECDKLLPFPADEYVSENTRRIICRDHNTLNVMVTQYSLMFKGTDWIMGQWDII